MKSSEYNYYVPYNNGVIFMNGISEATFWVGDKLANAFREIIENPDSHTEYVDFLVKMKAQGFVIDDNTDEKALIDQKYQRLRQPNEYRIMILPTYQCNLRCWYCVQDHENSWLTDTSIERIKQLITKRLSNPEIKVLHIAWFGGEPLLAYDKLLDITQFAQELTKANGQSFVCGITTNGTLLTPQRIDALKEAGVTHYQITIDGERSKHDTVKQLGKLSAFDTTLANIAYLAKQTHCTLRFNYTKETFKPQIIINQIAERIPEEARRNISLNLQQVWQTIDNETVTIEDAQSMMELAKGIGIVPTLKPTGLCYVDFKHYDCIYPDGTVGKCNNGDTEIKAGTLLDDGKVDYSYADVLHYTSTYEQGKSECSNCKYLPFCWGPCTQKRYSQFKNSGKIHCFWSDKNCAMNEAICNTHLTQKYLENQD